MTAVSATSGEPEGLTPAVRRAVSAVDPDQPILDVAANRRRPFRSVIERRNVWRAIVRGDAAHPGSSGAILVALMAAEAIVPARRAIRVDLMVALRE